MNQLNQGICRQVKALVKLSLLESRRDLLADNPFGNRIGDRAFGVTTWADDPTVRQVQGALGVLGAARKAERLLAGIAAGVHARGVRRILVGGGETSGAIVQALGIPRVRPLPLGPLGGGLCVAEGDDPVSFFLKSGKLGTQDVFLRALTEMQP